jgi:hypothetical protein
MDDTPHHRRTADWEPPMPSETELLAALARSEADLAAGRIVPASVVHEELRAALERIATSPRWAGLTCEPAPNE